MKTRVKLQPGKINWKTGHVFDEEKSSQVGKKMRAHLDWYDPRTGSSPGGGNKDLMAALNERYEGANFIRGHLLNDHLGGLGIWENMFPITSNANAQHLANIERYAKQYLLNAHKEDTESALDETEEHNRHIVKYGVDVSNESGTGDFLDNPKVSFTCQASLHQPASQGEGVKTSHYTTVYSNPDIKVGQNDELAGIGWVSARSGRRMSPDERILKVRKKYKGRVLKDASKVDKQWPHGIEEYAEIDKKVEDMPFYFGTNSAENAGKIEGERIISDAEKRFIFSSMRKTYLQNIRAKLNTKIDD